MIRKITIVMSLFVMTGCGLGQPLQAGVHAKEAYRTCIIDRLESYSVRYSASERTVEKVTKSVVSECKGQEEAYLVAMTNLAVTITGGMVPPEKFLEDEEAAVRGDLHDLAVSLVEQSL